MKENNANQITVVVGGKEYKCQTMRAAMFIYQVARAGRAAAMLDACLDEAADDLVEAIKQLNKSSQEIK